jgi:hypothetical protein
VPVREHLAAGNKVAGRSEKGNVAGRTGWD